MSIPDLTSTASRCVAEALVREDLGRRCFRHLGMSDECAKIWVFNGYNTEKYCSKICWAKTLFRQPNNGPPPACQLSKCLECDEAQSGPIFKAVAGRTRRRSGLLSKICRPCETIANITHTSACPSFDTIMTLMEERTG